MGNACCSAGYTIKDGVATIDATKEKVDVSHKNVTSVTIKNLDIWSRICIRELNLSGNLLTSLPEEIGCRDFLTVLDLSDNKLTSLPAEIGMLTGLEKLYLCGNQLTSLPVEISNLFDLEELRLDGNPLTTPPMEVCKKGINAIRAYFLEHQAELGITAIVEPSESEVRTAAAAAGLTV